MVFDADGVVTGVASFDGENVDAGTASEVLTVMRRRDLVGELDFAGFDEADGSVLVTGVWPGSEPAQANLIAGDVITQVGSEPLTGGLAELCDAYPNSTTSLEFVRTGSRYEGDLVAGGFNPASWRSIQDLQEAVVRIDVIAEPIRPRALHASARLGRPLRRVDDLEANVLRGLQQAVR